MSIRSKYRQGDLSIHRPTSKKDKKLKNMSKIKRVLKDSNTMIQSRIQQPTKSVGASVEVVSSASELEAQAVRLILLETQLAKDRVDTMGAIGWAQNIIPKINKQFAKQIVSSALAANIYNNKEKEREKEKNFHVL